MLKFAQHEQTEADRALTLLRRLAFRGVNFWADSGGRTLHYEVLPGPGHEPLSEVDREEIRELKAALLDVLGPTQRTQTPRRPK